MQYTETPIKDGKDCLDGKHHCPDGETCCNAYNGDNDSCCPHAYICCGVTMCCPEGSTCCKIKDGDYSCCPMPNAVCCKDGLSCCQHGMTCCGTGCCPLTNAACCKDGISCCPHGTQCDDKGGCIGSHLLLMLMGLPVVNNMEKVQWCAL